MNYEVEKSIDISNVIPKAASFKIGRKEYVLLYHYGALKKLSEIYGGVSEALDAFQKNENPYELVINFLFAGLEDGYQVTKQEIEKWVGPGSVNLLYNLVFGAVLAAFGDTKAEDEVDEENALGEA